MPTPGSIHEGGELGYVLAHAFGAAFDNPDLDRRRRRRRRRGRDRRRSRDRGRERAFSIRRATAPCCRSCISTATRSADRPCSRAKSRRRHSRLARGPRLRGPRSSPATIRATVHQRLAAALDSVFDRIRDHPAGGTRRSGRAEYANGPRWPAIVLRTPKGWTGPAVVDGHAGRGHVPRRTRYRCRTPERSRTSWRCSRRGCAAIDPRRCSTTNGALRRRARSARAARRAAHGRATRTPTAGACLVPLERSELPRLRRRRPASRRPCCANRLASSARCCATSSSPTRREQLSTLLSRRDELESPRRACSRSRTVASSGGACRSTTTSRRRPSDGGAERASLRGVARGLSAHRPPRAVRHVRVVRDGVARR